MMNTHVTLTALCNSGRFMMLLLFTGTLSTFIQIQDWPGCRVGEKGEGTTSGAALLTAGS